MSVPKTVTDVLRSHVTLEVEGIDRMYLNVYVPKLQRELGVVGFLRYHRGHLFASSALLAPITDAFLQAIDAFTAAHAVPVVTFAKKQRKDDVAAEHLARFDQPEGVLFVGKAQEKTPVFRTEKRKNPKTGQCYPGIVRSTAMVNHVVDDRRILGGGSQLRSFYLSGQGRSRLLHAAAGSQPRP